jgi:diaminopimelate decarboxylase
VTVVGRHCESGDVLAPAATLPLELARGDVVAMAATGAYAYPLASIYNRFGRPAVVGVRDGVATQWIRREEPDDMDRLDVILGTPWEAPTVSAAKREGGT